MKNYTWPESAFEENSAREIFGKIIAAGRVCKTRKDRQHYLNIMRKWLGTNSIVKTKAFCRQALERWNKKFPPHEFYVDEQGKVGIRPVTNETSKT